MDDLISRAEAIKAICEDGTRLEREGRYILLMPSRKQRDADILSALPTVDAVPVVRCKDCRYWQDNNGGEQYDYCKWRLDETPDEDDFCSLGERKEGDYHG